MMRANGMDGVYNNQAFRDGKKAYEEGKHLDDNPHNLYSQEYDEWKRGMTEAAQEDGVEPL